ncbi:uncharacterized protein LOC144100530 [Amblyomma americanum]
MDPWLTPISSRPRLRTAHISSCFGHRIPLPDSRRSSIYASSGATATPRDRGGNQAWNPWRFPSERTALLKGRRACGREEIGPSWLPRAAPQSTSSAVSSDDAMRHWRQGSQPGSGITDSTATTSELLEAQMRRRRSAYLQKCFRCVYTAPIA